MTYHAQFDEDKILDQLLEGQEGGFYVDVGAFDPTLDSVTKHFYDKGWVGINIEPVPGLIDAFKRDRPLDINLDCAASDRDGEALLCVINDTGLSTLESDIGREMVEGRSFRMQRVRTRTLRSIFVECIPLFADGRPVTSIGFMKIDVEGHEAEVIAGNDWTMWRPRFLCIEATYPLSKELNCAKWFDVLTNEHDYNLVDFDGLNMYFRDSHFRK